MTQQVSNILQSRGNNIFATGGRFGRIPKKDPRLQQIPAKLLREYGYVGVNSR